MASYNKVMLMGNLTRDLELRYLPKGTPLVDVPLAVNRSYTLENGEKREEVTYVDVTFMGRQAEVLCQYLTKGRPVFVEGRLKLDQWDDKETGKKRSALKVVGESFQFLGGRDGGSGGGGGNSGGGNSYESEGGGGGGGGGYTPRSAPQSRPSGGGAPSRPPARPAPAPEPEEVDDIPF